GDGVLGGRGELCRVGDVRLHVRAAVGGVHQERVHLHEHRQGPVVVGAGRVQVEHGVGGADADDAATAVPVPTAVEVLGVGAGGERQEGGSRGGDQPGGAASCSNGRHGQALTSMGVVVTV